MKRITIVVDVVTDLDADTLERHFEGFLEPGEIDIHFKSFFDHDEDEPLVDVKCTTIDVVEVGA